MLLREKNLRLLSISPYLTSYMYMHATECNTMLVNAFKLLVAWNCQDSTLDLTALLLAWSGTTKREWFCRVTSTFTAVPTSSPLSL
jgi:hypothetical protein